MQLVEQPETLGMVWDRVMYGLRTQGHVAYDWFWNIPISVVGQVIVSVVVVVLIMGALFGGFERWGNHLEEKGKKRGDW